MKGGVDVVDLVSISASTRCKTNRWTINANSFICDTVKTNARTLYNEINNKKLTTFEFTYQLAKELVLPFIQQRYDTPTGLQTSLKRKMKDILYPNAGELATAAPAPAPAPAPTPAPAKGTCRQCLDHISGDNYKAKKAKLNNKLKNKCMTCDNFVCNTPGHLYFVCGTCKDFYSGDV